MESRKRVIAALGGMSAEQRAEIVRWCDAFGVQSLTRKDNQFAEVVFDELALCLAEYYQTSPLSLTLFIRTRTKEYRRLLHAVDRVLVVANGWWPNERRNTKLALLRYLCRIVFSTCTQRTRKVSWNQLINGLQEIEASINDAFPGWLYSGIFQQKALERVTGDKCVRNKPDPQAGTEERRPTSSGRSVLHHSRRGPSRG